MTAIASGSASFRQLARLIGVNEKSVRKARLRGVFSARSVGKDGGGAMVVTDLNLAVAEWEKSGRRLRGPRARLASLAPATVAPPIGLSSPGPVPVHADDAGLADPSQTQDVDRVGNRAAPSLVDAQTIAMVERARKLRLENDLREGLLLEVDQAAKEGFEFSRVLRESILNIPARLSAELAAESDAARVYLRLDTALREALESTATTLEVAVNG